MITTAFAQKQKLEYVKYRSMSVLDGELRKDGKTVAVVEAKSRDKLFSYIKSLDGIILQVKKWRAGIRRAIQEHIEFIYLCVYLCGTSNYYQWKSDHQFKIAPVKGTQRNPDRDRIKEYEIADHVFIPPEYFRPINYLIEFS